MSKNSQSAKRALLTIHLQRRHLARLAVALWLGDCFSRATRHVCRTRRVEIVKGLRIMPAPVDL
jgi:hypothetical protein